MSTNETKPDPLGELVEKLRGAVTSGVPTREVGKPWAFAEAATHLGMTVKHLRYLADLGQIATIRLGKRKRAIADKEMKRIEREGIA